MAKSSKITIRVEPSRASAVVTYSTTGRYGRTAVNGFLRRLPQSTVFPNSSAEVFWQAVIAVVVADLTANPTPP